MHLGLNTQITAHTSYTAAQSRQPRVLCRVCTESYFSPNGRIKAYKKSTSSKEGDLTGWNFNETPVSGFS